MSTFYVFAYFLIFLPELNVHICSFILQNIKLFNDLFFTFKGVLVS
jgi:hypothetical protein